MAQDKPKPHAHDEDYLAPGDRRDPDYAKGEDGEHGYRRSGIRKRLPYPLSDGYRSAYIAAFVEYYGVARSTVPTRTDFRP